LVKNCDTPLDVLQGVGGNGPNQGVKYALILCLTCPTKEKNCFIHVYINTT
jgi:hypothetical protein